jgi:hypothetical protein
MFRLKDDLWTTAFDPYFPHYSKQKVEKVYENYIEQFKNKVQDLGRVFVHSVRYDTRASLPHCVISSEPRFVSGSSHRVPTLPTHLRGV